MEYTTLTPTPTPTPILNEIDEIDQMIFSALAGKPTPTPTIPAPTPTPSAPCSSCTGSCTWQFFGNCEGYTWYVISRGCNRSTTEVCPCYCTYPVWEPSGYDRYIGGQTTSTVCTNNPFAELDTTSPNGYGNASTTP